MKNIQIEIKKPHLTGRETDILLDLVYRRITKLQNSKLERDHSQELHELGEIYLKLGIA